MKPLLALLVAVAVALLGAHRADAQGFAPLGAPPTFVDSRGFSSPAMPPGTVYSYSYYAAFPGPARGYVGYGFDGFPYHGSPYGHVYDRWTWPYLGGPPSALDRYYDPPVK